MSMLLSELPAGRPGDRLRSAVSRLLDCLADNLGEGLRELRLICPPQESFGDNLLLLLEESIPLVGRNNLDVIMALENVEHDDIGGDVK